jgi:hypothetical protein
MKNATRRWHDRRRLVEESTNAAVMTASLGAELTRTIAAAYVRTLLDVMAMGDMTFFVYHHNRAIVTHVRTRTPRFLMILCLRQWAECDEQGSECE